MLKAPRTARQGSSRSDFLWCCVLTLGIWLGFGPDIGVAAKKRPVAQNHGQSHAQRHRQTPEQDIVLESKAIAKNAKNASAYVRRANSHLRLSHGLQAEEHLRAAADDLAKAVTLTPRDASLHSRLAEVAVRLKEYQLAVSEYTAAIALTPGRTEHYTGRGRAYFHLRRDRAATADFRRAVRLNPTLRTALEREQREIRQARRNEDASLALVQQLRGGAHDDRAEALDGCPTARTAHADRCEDVRPIGLLP